MSSFEISRPAVRTFWVLAERGQYGVVETNQTMRAPAPPEQFVDVDAFFTRLIELGITMDSAQYKYYTGGIEPPEDSPLISPSE